jgi:radical SAM superfamily enzyme YgiQ (UPF0313 family)
MKILLIYPYCLEDRLQAEDVRVVPIGLYYVGAVLRENGYAVEILNWHDINKAPEKIRQTLKAEQPDVIGFSIVHANRWGAIEIAREAAKLLPAARIVFGGIGATFLWEHLLRHFPEIDFVVLGEGEYVFLKLVRCLEAGDFSSLEHIKGIAFRAEGKPRKTADAAMLADLDRLPNPARYFNYNHVSSTRGCPGKCNFCGSPRFWGPKVRFHSADYFVRQLELLYRKGISFFYFSDDTFTLKKEHVIAICKQILDRNLKITWVAISKVNHVGEEILYWMRKAGCIQISYGVESGSAKIRKLLNKNIRNDQIKKAFALTTRYGILARAYFIYGCPGEDWNTIGETVALIREIKPLSVIFYILDIFPGTRLYEEFKRDSGFSDDIWFQKIEDIMYFETDAGLSEQLMLDFGRALREAYYRILPECAETVELIDNREFNALHADFLSRLAMTFSHGDYASNEALANKEETAEKLYERALGYYPDRRAFLGLGIIRQKRSAFEQSILILSEGLRHFPDSEQLNLCAGVSYMNIGQFEKALSHFLRFPHSDRARQYVAECYQATGRFRK